MGQDLFSKNLSFFIRLRGQTQKKLSETTGITECSISLYLKGKREPTYSSIRKLADALKIDPGLFFRELLEKEGTEKERQADGIGL